MVNAYLQMGVVYITYDSGENSICLTVASQIVYESLFELSTMECSVEVIELLALTRKIPRRVPSESRKTCHGHPCSLHHSFANAKNYIYRLFVRILFSYFQSMEVM